jgi:hypothetical protein
LLATAADGMTVTSVPDLTAMAASEISCNNGRKRSSVLRWPCDGGVGFDSREQRCDGGVGFGSREQRPEAKFYWFVEI